MTKKDIKRLDYLDTELSEITLGLTWLLFFPVILILEKGFNPFLIIPSILIGLATIKSALSPCVKHRKTMAYACFIMSIVAASMFGDEYEGEQPEQEIEPEPQEDQE